MAHSIQQSAITHRLQQLKNLWSKTMEVSSPPKVIRWHVLPDEVRMVQGFMELEATEHGDIPDLFIRFNAPFVEEKYYCGALLSELTSRYLEDTETQEDLKKNGIELTWNPKKLGDGPTEISFEVFWKSLVDFLLCIPDFEGNLILYLTPDSTESYKDMERWLMEAVESGIPDRILFTLVDNHNQNLYKKLSSRFPDLVVSLRPELKMYEAMKQMASGGGNSNDPEAKFSLLIIELSEAAGKKDISEMEEIGKEAIQLTQKYKWPLLEAMAYLTLGGNYLHFNKSGKAIEYYDKAFFIAQRSYDDGREDAIEMIIQALMCKGYALQAKDNLTEAAQTFANAGDFAAQVNDWFKAMESYRMAAKAMEEKRYTKEALQYCERSFDFGRKLPEETRQESSFLLLADCYLKLSDILFPIPEVERIEKEIEEWAGAQWKDKLSKFKKENLHASSKAI